MSSADTDARPTVAVSMHVGCGTTTNVPVVRRCLRLTGWLVVQCRHVPQERVATAARRAAVAAYLRESEMAEGPGAGVRLSRFPPSGTAWSRKRVDFGVVSPGCDELVTRVARPRAARRHQVNGQRTGFARTGMSRPTLAVRTQWAKRVSAC